MTESDPNELDIGGVSLVLDEDDEEDEIRNPAGDLPLGDRMLETAGKVVVTCLLLLFLLPVLTLIGWIDHGNGRYRVKKARNARLLRQRQRRAVANGNWF